VCVGRSFETLNFLVKSAKKVPFFISTLCYLIANMYLDDERYLIGGGGKWKGLYTCCGYMYVEEVGKNVRKVGYGRGEGCGSSTP